jgi:hypothetical protein
VGAGLDPQAAFTRAARGLPRPDQGGVLALSAAKEEALASIRKREAMHAIEEAFGPASRYAGPVIWVVKRVHTGKSDKLPSSLSDEEINARAQCAR